MQKRMSMRKAIYEILTEHTDCLVPIEGICQQNKVRDLFRKGDGKHPDPRWMLFGIMNYLDQFEVFVRLRR
jgi:hypothetical protein